MGTCLETLPLLWAVRRMLYLLCRQEEITESPWLLCWGEDVHQHCGAVPQNVGWVREGRAGSWSVVSELHIAVGKGGGKQPGPAKKKKIKSNPPSPVFTHPNGLPLRRSAVSGSLWTGKGLCCQAAW